MLTMTACAAYNDSYYDNENNANGERLRNSITDVRDDYDDYSYRNRNYNNSRVVGRVYPTDNYTNNRMRTSIRDTIVDRDTNGDYLNNRATGYGVYSTPINNSLRNNVSGVYNTNKVTGTNNGTGTYNNRITNNMDSVTNRNATANNNLTSRDYRTEDRYSLNNSAKLNNNINNGINRNTNANNGDYNPVNTKMDYTRNTDGTKNVIEKTNQNSLANRAVTSTPLNFQPRVGFKGIGFQGIGR